MRKFKKIPKFKTSSEEDKFWKKNDSADFIDWSKAKKSVSLPKLKVQTKTISLRLPESSLNEIRALAHKVNIPYQSLMKILLAQGMKSFRDSLK